MRRFTTAVALALSLVLSFTPDAAGQINFPEGYDVTAHEVLGPGVEQFAFHSGGPPQAVHVARLAPDSPFTLRSVLSNDAVSGSPRLERTSSMCIRIGCLAAVNGDFHDPRSGVPIGGVVGLGQVLRSPKADHHQLVIRRDGSIEAGVVPWRGELVSTDLRRVGIDGVNVPRPPDGVALYNWANGTGTPAGGVELVLRPVDPAGPLRLDQTFIVHLDAVRGAGGPIPSGTAVLSGTGAGAAALEDLWRRANDGTASRNVLLRLETEPGAVESIGGSPVIVEDGRPVPIAADTSFVRGRHPRTIVGQTADGDTLLVTVDGRQPGYSEGMSLAEAADLMVRLGAVEAINLDGGGSTTFVTDGRVVNRTSDRLVRRDGQERLTALARPGESVLGHVERPVSVALAIVPEGAEAAPPTAPAPTGLDLPKALPFQTSPQDIDPASDPTGSVPALSLPPPEQDLGLVKAAPGGSTDFGQVATTDTAPMERPVPLTSAVLSLAAAVAVLGERRLAHLLRGARGPAPDPNGLAHALRKVLPRRR